MKVYDYGVWFRTFYFENYLYHEPIYTKVFPTLNQLNDFAHRLVGGRICTLLMNNGKLFDRDYVHFNLTFDVKAKSSLLETVTWENGEATFVRTNSIDYAKRWCEKGVGVIFINK